MEISCQQQNSLSKLIIIKMKQPIILFALFNGAFVEGCNIAECETKEVKINDGYKTIQEFNRDASVSPNFLPIDKQDFIQNAKQDCCITQSCTISGDTQGRWQIGSDGITVEYDFSAPQESYSDLITVSCSYLPAPDTFTLTSNPFQMFMKGKCENKNINMINDYLGQTSYEFNPGSGYTTIAPYTDFLTIENYNCVLQQCEVLPKGCQGTRSDNLIQFSSENNLEINLETSLLTDIVCIKCTVEDTSATPYQFLQYKVDDISFSIFVSCEVDPPPLITAGTASYSWQLIISDASPTQTVSIDIGGEYTSGGDEAVCIIGGVSNADQASAGYATPSPFASGPSYDVASSTYIQTFTPTSTGSFQFHFAVEGTSTFGQNFDHFSNQFTVDIYCGVEIIQQPAFDVYQSAYDGSWQVFTFPYFTSMNSLCSIASYQISSEANSIVAISGLVLEDTGIEYKVKREITDGNVYDYTFYLHVTPTDEKDGNAKTFGPFHLLTSLYCTSSDVTGIQTYPDLNFEAGSGSGFQNVAQQNFMTQIFSCQLQSCQVMDGSCTFPLSNPEIQFSSNNELQVNLNPSNLFSETACVSCTYTDILTQTSSVTKVTNPFQIDMECQINTPSNFPEEVSSYDVMITDSQSTASYQFDFGGEFTSSSDLACPIAGVYHADADSSVFNQPTLFVSSTSSFASSSYVSLINLIPGTYQFYFRAVAIAATGNLEESSAVQTMNIYCDPSLIVAGNIQTIQTGLVQNGDTYFQRFVVPKFSSINTVGCDILSYALSSKSDSIEDIQDLTLDSSSSTTEVFIERPFNGDFTDFEFYLHVETEGGQYGTKTVTQKLFWQAPCELNDIITSQIADQNMLQAQAFQTIQRFVSTQQSLCKLKMCQLRDQTCQNPLENSNIALDASLNLQFSLATGYSEEICIYCEYTDRSLEIASIPVTSNVFTISVQQNETVPVVELVNWAPEFEEDLPQNQTYYRDAFNFEQFNYTLPSVIEIEGDESETIVTGLDESFMSFENGMFQLNVTNQSGSYVVRIQLKDEWGKSNYYSMTFIIIPYVKTAPIFEPVFEPPVVQKEEVELPDVSVQLVEVTPSGEAHMEFSTYMNTKIDKSLINTESLEVYVISMNENVNVGLTWSLKSYEGRSLVIQLKFNNSQDISSSFSYDKLVIHFKIVKNRFISQELLVDLSEQFRTVFGKIPKQLSQDSPLSVGATQVAESMKPALKGVMAATLVTNLLLSGVLSKFIEGMRPLQIVTHLLMFKISVPANVMIFMENILPIAQYDYLEPYWTDFVIMMFDIDVEDQELEKFGNQDVTDQILTLGYENQSSILNLGTISLFLFLYAMRICLYALMLTPIGKTKLGQKIMPSQDGVFFQDLINIITESFLELLIAGYLSIYQINKETFALKFSMFFGYVCLILCSSVLVMIKFQSSSDGLSFEGGTKINLRPSQFEYYSYYFLRRILFVLIIIMYNENLQTQLMLFLNCFSFMYLAYRKPYTRTLNRIQVFNDFMVNIISFHMIFFQGLIVDLSLQEKLGLSIIACILILMSGSMLDVTYSIAKTAYLYSYKYYLIIKDKIKRRRSKNVVGQSDPQTLQNHENRTIDLEMAIEAPTADLQQSGDNIFGISYQQPREQESKVLPKFASLKNVIPQSHEVKKSQVQLSLQIESDQQIQMIRKSSTQMNTDNENSECVEPLPQPGSHDGQVKPTRNITLSFRPIIQERSPELPQELDNDISFGVESNNEISLSSDSSLGASSLSLDYKQIALGVIIRNHEPKMTEIIFQNFVEERAHMMDLSRSGHEIRNLNPFESRRLENETLLLEYLEVFQPVWLAKVRLENPSDIPSEKFPSKLFVIHISKELRNIVHEKFDLRMFFKVEYQPSESLLAQDQVSEVPSSSASKYFEQKVTELPSNYNDITQEQFISAENRQKLIEDVNPSPSEDDIEVIEQLYINSYESLVSKLEISKHRNKKYEQQHLTPLQLLVKNLYK